MPPDSGNLNNGQTPEEKTPLDRLYDRVYKPGAVMDIKPPQLTQHPVYTEPEPAQWTPPPPPKHKKRLSLAVWFLLGALGFFLLAILASTLFFILGTRAVTNNNITITVQGPASIASGTAVPLVVTVVNHNPATISGTDITLNFPNGTRSADDVTQPLVRYADTLGDIPAGGSVTRTVQAVLFGSANQSVTIPVSFDYHTANSDALFTKQQNYNFTITSAPLAITVKTVSSISTGQPLSIVVGVRSNATTVLNNIAIAGQFPAGFMPQTSGTTSPSFIMVGMLQPGQEKDFTIQGTMSGTDNTQAAFNFTVGTAASDGTSNLSVAYASQESDVTIAQPFLATSLSLNNTDTSPVVVTPGQPVSGVLTWSNSVSSAITNAQVTVQLSGNGLDTTSVTTPDGFYNSGTKIITFNGQTEPSLANLNAGDTGSGSFTLSTLPSSGLGTLRNPTIQLVVSIAGQHGANGATETIHNTLVQNVRVATNLALTSSVVHATGPFTNSGPVPPTVGQTTTYTVLWNVTNTVNDVGGGTVTAILPPYVTFTAHFTPNDGSLSYNSTSNTVTWKIGDVPAGSVGNAALQAAFQVSITPSASQLSTSPILVGNQTLVGTDRFTQTQVGNTADALDIETPSDPHYNQAFGTVEN